MRRYILGFAILGLLGCFLPAVGGTSLTLFDLRYLTWRDPMGWRAWLIAAAFAAPAIATWRASAASARLVAAVSFGYLALQLGPRCLHLVLYAGIGGKMIGVAIVGGALATVGELLERRRRMPSQL